MNANLLLERWRIGKRIESGGYLDYKFTVAESLDLFDLFGSTVFALHRSDPAGIALLGKCPMTSAIVTEPPRPPAKSKLRAVVESHPNVDKERR
jgi:hypothetical protein